MSSTLPLLRGEITLADALESDDNMIPKLQFFRQREDFFLYLYAHKSDIEATVSFHLRQDDCRVSDLDEWMGGSYNVCIPVTLPGGRRVLFRVPLPYKIGEARNPGNVDEKLRCEAASYLWIKDNCPDIPIPRLFGFGFPDGQTFTDPENTPFPTQLVWQLKRLLLSMFRFLVPCRFVPRKRSSILKTGYLIISMVTEGEMLSNSWEKHIHDKNRRSNLFRGLAHIILSLNRFPLPHIGSLTLNNQGFISLANRPLTLRLQTLENESIPIPLSRETIYSDVGQYILDLLECHDNRIRLQPNSIHNVDDGKQQLAALTTMRAILRQFTRREYQKGPFVFSLTDLHRSNIFVDDEWCITNIIDLEWACSLPIEIQSPPYWLTGRSVDDMQDEKSLSAFDQAVREFLQVFGEEEKKTTKDQPYQTPIMRRCWESGSFWYFHVVNSPKGLLNIFNHHIQPLFKPEHCNMAIFDEVLSPYWGIGAEDIIEKKIEDEAR